MSTRQGNRARRFSSATSAARLFREDKAEVVRLAKQADKTEGEVLRELVHEALRTRRLRKAGRDETTAPVRDAQREIVRQETAEMKKQIDEISRVQGHMLNMLEDVQLVLGPLIFEILYDTWTDGRMNREILLRHIFFPELPESQRQGKSYETLRAEAIEAAQIPSRQKVAEYREKLMLDPASSRRFIFP